MYVCLWSPDWSIGGELDAEAAGAAAAARPIRAAAAGESDGGGDGGGAETVALEAALLEVVPRVAVEARGVVWADAHGLDAVRTAAALLDRLRAYGAEDARAGAASVPAAALAAAWVLETGSAGDSKNDGSPGGAGTAGAPRRIDRPDRVDPAERWRACVEYEDDRVLVVERGREREFLTPLPLAALGPDERLRTLLEGVGLLTCGGLAALDRESVEVRFGSDGVRLWRLARADDAYRGPRFDPAPRERPHASIDFVDYVITDPAKLVFTANALLGGVCETLRAHGEHARRLRLELELANGESWRRTIRPARPTAGRERWLRLVRGRLERITVPDAVAGMRIEVEAVEPAAVRQGDLFDPGFATADSVEAALARLLDERGAVIVEPETDRHPLAERRTEWCVRSPEAAAATGPSDRSDHSRGSGGSDGPAAPAAPAGPAGPAGFDRTGAGGADAAPPPMLTLQLLPEPRPIRIEAGGRRDHAVPVRYHDGRRWHALTTIAGPDRISGGHWEDSPFAREYFRCVTGGGTLVWLYHDARRGAWYLHGWWD